jgi:hypothetical protein
MTGATSGTVTLTPPAVAGTQSYTLPSAVPAVSGYALTSTTGGTMSWSASGKIVQVVTASFGTQTNFTTTTMTDTGLTASITPTSASNTILVFANLSGLKVANAANSINFQLLRGASVIAGGGQYNGFWQTGTASAPSEMGFPTKLITYMDSPATTSSTTYKVQCAARSGSTTVTINLNDGGAVAAPSTLILMEVAP